MELKRIGIDKVVLNGLWVSGSVLETSTFLKDLAFRVLGIGKQSWISMEGSRGSPRFWSRDHGVDLKMNSGGYRIVVEFQSTFFCFSEAFKLVKLMAIALSEETGNQISISEIHIAQDYVGLKPNDFFKKGFDSGRYIKRFKCTHIPYVSEDDSKTFYLKSSSKNWSLIVYDKSRELRENKSKVTDFKNSHYKKLGYFDEDITRIELRINSKICRRHFHNFFSISEDRLCSSIMRDFFKGHKIYEIKKGEIFNEKNPSRNRLYPLWEKVLNHDSFDLPTQSKDLKDEILLYETLDEEKIIERFSAIFSKYKGILTIEIMEEILRKAELKKEQRIEKFRRSIERQEKILKSSKNEIKDVFVRDPETGKIVSNLRVNSFFSIN